MPGLWLNDEFINEVINSMMYLLALIITIGLLVTVHEYGHFWVARRCGVKVLRFSVGFGRVLFSWKDRQGTEFAISAIPLGGYVKMLDAREAEVDVAEANQEFTSKNVWQRIAIVVAGPMANFLFAIFAYGLLFMSGLSGLKPVVGAISETSPAYKAELRRGDLITQVDGKSVTTWQDVSLSIVERLGESGVIAFELDNGQIKNIPISNWLKGEKDPEILSALGLVPDYPDILAVIDSVQSGSRAEQGGLASGDHILSVNNEAVADWYHWVELIKVSAEKKLSVVVDRGGQLQELTLIPGEKKAEGGEPVGFLGASVKVPEIPEEMIIQKRSDPISAFIQGVERTLNTISLSLKMFGKMILGQVSLQNLSGPVSIAKMAGESIASGPEIFLGFLAFISVSLGVFNLLPVPMLDGGHLLYYVIELFRGKPLSEKVQQIGLQIGASLLFTMVAFAIYFDLMRL